jgi:hypothetical protein
MLLVCREIICNRFCRNELQRCYPQWGKFLMKQVLILVVLACSALVGCSGSGSSSTSPGDQTPMYDSTIDYPNVGTLVRYTDNKIYSNAWYASAGHCPVEADCPGKFEPGLWKIHDPSVKHEFANYDYAALMSTYPSLAVCTASDYNQSTVKSVVDQSILKGELARAAPPGGYTRQDKEALYREYMLPCKPNLKSHVPDNVATVMSVMPESVWNSLTKYIYSGDSSQKYMTADGKNEAWPAEDTFTSNAYTNFLAAVARYPFFCGEKGYFSSVDEACKRELASLFAHAAQETGETKITHSFTWLREYGFVNGSTYFNTGCSAPFDCTSNSFARYYGRGPKQLTYYYNYAGFSAAYFNGNYNYLLKWPDMVAYDGRMFFQSALWFVMTHQPPKPSIHDVMLGRYQPSATACLGPFDCNGLQSDPVTGVKNNFNVTIEVVNGGPECRGENKQKSVNRSNGYAEMLELLKAVKTGSELTLVNGCEFIAVTNPDKSVSIFGSAANLSKAGSLLNTWLDMSGSSCQAQCKGGVAMISVTATGILSACKSK